MSWDERIITEDELRPYLADVRPRLIDRVGALIEHQKRTWPMLAQGYRAFAAIDSKRIESEESAIVVQHNPGRVGSTAAAVDRASVEARKCFLCPDALPPEEKGVEYGDLIFLCNPFPVLDRHLSIVHRDHIPQKITGNIETLLGIAADLSPDYFVLYNGPRCGASAPDHLHFQACSRALLPIEETIRGSGVEDSAPHCSVCAESAIQGLEVFTINDCGRSLVVFGGSSIDEVAGWVEAALAELSAGGSESEPMVNLICTYERQRWSVYLFPRARHRPACFYDEGGERLLVSPGAIDMAGVVVVPEREHFDRIGATEVRAIFSEVSLTEAEVNEVTERVCIAMGAEEIP
jgi:hypothetical protein